MANLVLLNWSVNIIYAGWKNLVICQNYEVVKNNCLKMFLVSEHAYGYCKSTQFTWRSIKISFRIDLLTTLAIL